ncbi:hypothetical protein DEFDS_P006 (plasmid) [Deferribacter desulfuricans SSM1]|uniref:Uncharacterized protein n=1 Tax=Deferribacter desulfuricans (strain DSM 14783 / JCM 11476 / NBRC 101012 / SSM1) TaxID=639282 RepID=D3PEJ2_DEFDS|nr:hypothetical protein [Deferribacter desulfuricans]BAI81634.1 hypothetical protein DEFDS_P006 [Deferribacter desulfuricans SSM1]
MVEDKNKKDVVNNDEETVLKVSMLDYFLSKRIKDMDEYVTLFNKQLKEVMDKQKDQEKVARYKKNKKFKKNS